MNRRSQGYEPCEFPLLHPAAMQVTSLQIANVVIIRFGLISQMTPPGFEPGTSAAAVLPADGYPIEPLVYETSYLSAALSPYIFNMPKNF